MTNKEQLEFTTKIINSQRDHILEKIKMNAENIESWDGHELRKYIADKYLWGAVGNFEMKGKRKKEYGNTVLINNL